MYCQSQELSRSLEILIMCTFDTEFPTYFNKTCTYITFKSAMTVSNYGLSWLVGCVLRPIDSEVILRRHPHLLSLANDVKLGFYIVPIGN